MKRKAMKYHGLSFAKKRNEIIPATAMPNTRSGLRPHLSEAHPPGNCIRNWPSRKPEAIIPSSAIVAP